VTKAPCQALGWLLTKMKTPAAIGVARGSWSALGPADANTCHLPPLTDVFKTVRQRSRASALIFWKRRPASYCDSRGRPSESQFPPMGREGRVRARRSVAGQSEGATCSLPHRTRAENVPNHSLRHPPGSGRAPLLWRLPSRADRIAPASLASNQVAAGWSAVEPYPARWSYSAPLGRSAPSATPPNGHTNKWLPTHVEGVFNGRSAIVERMLNKTTPYHCQYSYARARA
jgi:hypothetical protein